MSQSELLERVAKVLDSRGIDYMVTGSTVSSLQGEPRSTHDIDLVVALDASAAEALTTEFRPPEFYLSLESILDAIKHRSMFNLLRIEDGDKVDFWLLTDEPFDQSRFARRRIQSIGGVQAKVSSPEDTIIAKLRWAKMSGGSEKQFLDALRVFEVQHANLDLGYLSHWSRQLQLDELWLRLKSEAEPL